MRKTLMLILSVATLVFVAEEASAMEPKPYVSQTDLKSACDKNGGTWNTSSDGGYSCGKKCSNAGGYCVYGCGPNKDGQIQCNGSSPERRVPPGQKWTIDQVLNNGMKLAGPPKTGPLETGPSSPQGPSGPGSTKPGTPPAGKLY